jgi:hypothetical protein
MRPLDSGPRSVLPAHLAAEVGVWSISLVLALFATNCSEALIAAAGVRWFSDAPGRFDTPRWVTVFIVAAERWFAISVVPLDRPESGAVISCTEVTERRRAELDAKSRQRRARPASDL